MRAMLPRSLPRFVQRLLLGAALVLALALGFAAYLRPAFIVDLANRIVLCF